MDAIPRPKKKGKPKKKKERLRVKIISMGDVAVGKSCVIKRYCEGKFITRYISTIGVDYGVRGVTIDDVDVKVNFWDLSGAAGYFEVRNEFYKDTQGALLVYDVTNKKSFDNLDKWLQEATDHGVDPKKISIAVCGNKTDQEKDRVISLDEGKKWAQTHGFAFFEVSAASGLHVNELFNTLFLRVFRQVRNLPRTASRGVINK